MSKGSKALLVVGMSLVFLELLVLGIGIKNVGPEGSVGPPHYGIQKGDRISWGIFDTYSYASGEEIESFKAVFDAEVLANEDLDIDGDVEPDIALMTRLILGTFDGGDIDIPMYLDIYVVSTILLKVLGYTSTTIIPPINAIHYVSSETVVRFGLFLEALQGSGTITQDDLEALLQYLSFFHIGILPDTFDFDLLVGFFDLVNELLLSTFGYNIFSILNTPDELRVSITSATLDDLQDYLATLDVQFTEPGVQASFTIAWDKQSYLLQEVIVTFNHFTLGILRRVGFQLVRTTMTDDIPNTLDQTSFSLSLDDKVQQMAEIMTIKIAMFILVGVCVFNLVILFVIKRGRQI